MVIVSIIALCAAILGFFLGFALLNAKGGNRYANFLLSAFLCISSLYLLGLVPFHGQWDVSHWWTRLGFFGLFLTGPLLYAYVLAMTNIHFRISIRHSIHLLPIVLLGIDIIINGVNDQDFILAAQTGWPPNKYVVMGVLRNVHLMAYIFAALFILRRHSAQIAHQFSYQDGVNLSWLKVLLNWWLALSLLMFGIAIARIFFSVEFWPRGINSIGVMVCIYYLIAFKAIVQPTIFSQFEQPQALVQPSTIEPILKKQPAPSQTAQYETSSLDSNTAQLYWQQLQTHMQQQQPYLNSELRIKDLAASLDIPSNHLSQVINQYAQQNFFELVNQYRVEAAQRMLVDDNLKKVNVSLIALDAGFNSQSAFYKQFKQRVGKTPKQFREQFNG